MINPVSSTATGSTCPPASGNTACRSTVAVLTPALTVTKSANATNATAGATLTYTITVSNTGQTPYPAASFTDSLSGVLTNADFNSGSASATSGTLSYAAPVLSWTGALTVGASATVTYSVTIKNTAAAGTTLPNSVVSPDAGNNCPAASSDPRCTATVTVTSSVAITLTKTADVQFTTAGSVVHYTITVDAAALLFVTPSFSEPLAGILDDATLDAGSLTASGGTASISDATLSWTGPPLTGSAAHYTITYSVTVNSVLTGDDRLSSTLTSASAGTNCGAASADPRCSNVVPVAALLIQQGYTETSTTPGSLVHLSATFTNIGQYAYNGISVASATGGTVDDASPTGDQTATSGNLVLTPMAIIWTGDIPVGGTVTVTGTLTVQNPDTGDRLLKGTLISTAPGNNCTSRSSDPRCTAMLPVLLPGVTISTVADTTFVVPGGTAHFTITVANSGQTPYQGLAVTDNLAGVLDDADYNGNATTTAGSVDYTAPALTWTGDLAVGATAVVSFSVTAHNPATGDKTMVNPVSSTAVGSSCPPASGNAACHATVAVLTPALTITSVTNLSTAKPGDVVRYTVTAANSGQTPYAAANFSVPLTGILDDATYNGDAAADTGTVSVQNSVLSWTGALAIGSTVTVGFSVTVQPPQAGDFQLSATVVSTVQGSTCPADAADPRCSTTVPIAGLRVAYAADVSSTQPTGTVRYTGTFVNIGRVPYFGVSINDDLSDVIDDATYSGDAVASAGSVAVQTTTHQLVWTGDLAVGATVTDTFTVTVNNPDPGNQALTSAVSTAAVASNCPLGGTDSACALRIPVLTPALTIRQTVDTTTTTPGGEVGYTLTISNTGQTDYAAATVTDTLAGVLPDADYGGDATASSGTVAFTSPDLVWSGDLPIGQTVVVGFHVQVRNPDLGDKQLVNSVFSGEVGSTCPAGSTDAACVSTVTVLVPALNLSITTDSTTTTPGSTVGYTIAIRNSGQTDYASAGVTVALSGVLDDAAYAGDAQSTVGAVQFSAGSLNWAGALPAGATAVIRYSVVVADPDGGNRLLTTSVSSAAAGSTCTEANPCINDVPVLIPGLAVGVTADVATATPGQQVTFTVTMQNTGQVPYSDTAVSTDLSGVLDDASLSGDIRTTSGTATFQAPDIRWTGSLPEGATTTISFTVTVHNPADGDRTMSATVVAPVAGSTCPPAGAGPACTAAVTVLVPALTLRKSADSATTTPGSTVGYTITIANTGQTPYVSAVVTDSLDGVLNDADYNADAVAVGGGIVSYDSGDLIWTGDLPVGASATVTYSVTVHDPDQGDKVLRNSVTSNVPGSNCPPQSPAAQCSTVVPVLIPGLLISKTADTNAVVAGSSVEYTITVTNTGQTDYLPAVVTDSLAGVLDDADYRGDATASTGTVAFDNGTVTWTGALSGRSQRDHHLLGRNPIPGQW